MNTWLYLLGAVATYAFSSWVWFHAGVRCGHSHARAEFLNDGHNDLLKVLSAIR